MFEGLLSIAEAAANGNTRAFWALVVAAILHVAEEYVLDWRSWARDLSGFPLEWAQFWLVNAGFILLAMGAASIGWRRPELSLALPALTLINGLLFHLGPTLVLRSFSPGTITALALYLPISALLYRQAGALRLLTARVLVISTLLGATVMALPFVMLASGATSAP